MKRIFQNAAALRTEIQTSFNERLQKWYENVSSEYGVIGSGQAYFDELPREVDPNYIVNDFHVYYIEDGVKYHAAFSATDEQLFENKLDWLFDIWSEGSMPTTKEIKPLAS
jgi:hypothetical protein